MQAYCNMSHLRMRQTATSALQIFTAAEAAVSCACLQWFSVCIAKPSVLPTGQKLALSGSQAFEHVQPFHHLMTPQISVMQLEI